MMQRVYGWMAFGLGITALTSFICSMFMPAVIAGGFMTLWIIAAILELVLVFVFASRIDKMSFGKALGIFTIYSALNGFTLTPLFAMYTLGSVVVTFLITMAMFGIMSLIGIFVKFDMSGWGKYFLMALIGLIIATIVNIFVASSLLYWLTTYAGILVFVGLTAYDTQQIQKRLYKYGYLDFETAKNEVGTSEINKLALEGALELYLDFINLFIYLLRIFGNSK